MFKLKAIVSGFSTIIKIFKMLFDIILSFFETIGMVFRYLYTIVNLAFDVILTFPAWLKAFAVITISISIFYIIINREAGRSD